MQGRTECPKKYPTAQLQKDLQRALKELLWNCWCQLQGRTASRHFTHLGPAADLQTSRSTEKSHAPLNTHNATQEASLSAPTPVSLLLVTLP